MKLFSGQSLFSWLGKKVETSTVIERALLDASQQLYIKELALYTAVGLLADLLATCEFQVFRDGRPVKDGTWYRLNVSPNVNQSAAEFKAQWVTRLYYDGHALVVPVSGQLFVADHFQIQEYPLLGNQFVGISVDNCQLRKTFYAGDAYYLTQGDRSVKRLVDGVFAEYGELLAAAADASKRAGGEKYVFEVGRRASGTKEEQDAYMAQIQKNLQSFVKSVSSAYPITQDQKLTRMTNGSSGSYTGDVVSLRKDVYSIVASALHLPESLLSGNMTNVDQIVNQALTFAIDPLASRIGSELTRKTYAEAQITRDSCWIAVNTSNIGHVDPVTMADKLDKLIASGIYCIDEARRRCGQPELNTPWSQRHYITKNYDSVENTLDPLEGGD